MQFFKSLWNKKNRPHQNIVKWQRGKNTKRWGRCQLETQPWYDLIRSFHAQLILGLSFQAAKLRLQHSRSRDVMRAMVYAGSEFMIREEWAKWSQEVVIRSFKAFPIFWYIIKEIKIFFSFSKASKNQILNPIYFSFYFELHNKCCLYWQDTHGVEVLIPFDSIFNIYSQNL